MPCDFQVDLFGMVLTHVNFDYYLGMGSYRILEEYCHIFWTVRTAKLPESFPNMALLLACDHRFVHRKTLQKILADFQFSDLSY